MKRMFLILSGVALVFGLTVNAHALMFDFTGSLETGTSSMVFSESGVELTVTAERQTGDSILVTRNLTGGLGALTDSVDDPLLDSVGPNERLIFTITQLPVGIDALILESIYFNAYNAGNEDFGIIIDGVDMLGNEFSSPTDLWNVANDLTMEQRTINSFFSIRATDAGGEENFRIGSMEFTLYTEPAPVPEPSTLLLLGAGLTGLAVFRKFKKSA
ncbi:PEP-CTERM sorting domain-containing protein [Desulfuromonas sp. TF]|uniref:PEP-CTERM sorting domain-containing protein n=1 Tax=Desulfuromonas sp. TF TaxID=1232410 RepID=UPI0004897931|nr:PEP-CTERM sorting domain-containing protein [Desulfuromonas sp. TF]